VQHPIIIGKKKHKDIQFYTEVCYCQPLHMHTHRSSLKFCLASIPASVAFVTCGTKFVMNTAEAWKQG